MRRIALALACVVSLTAPALAVQPDEVLHDPALEARARTLSRELRCMVCQNQSIDESEAPLARDLRILVRERLSGGDSDRQVLDYLTDRYGDYVLLKPRLTWQNALLWGGPPTLLVLGAIALVALARRRMPAGQVAALTVDERSRVAELMRQRDG